MKRVSSLYRGSYDSCGRGIVRSALQPSLGCNPGRPRQNLVASSIAPLRRLVNFGPILRVSSEFLAHLFMSGSLHRPIDFSSKLMSILLHFIVTLCKRLVNLILVENYYSNILMHCKHH